MENSGSSFLACLRLILLCRVAQGGIEWVGALLSGEFMLSVVHIRETKPFACD